MELYLSGLNGINRLDNLLKDAIGSTGFIKRIVWIQKQWIENDQISWKAKAGVVK